MTAIRNPKDLPLPPPTQAWLSVLEAARIAGLGRSTIYELVTKKLIPAKRVGKRWLIPRAGLERFLQP